MDRLFERARPVTRSLTEELDAVRARDKAMALYAMTRAGLLRDDTFTLRLFRAALDRGLTVVLQPDRDGVDAYVLYPDQTWRVAAHRALLATSPWSWAAEDQQGVLLGYTAAERAAHLARLRWQIAAWGAPPVYALLARDQVRAVRELGQRSFGDLAGATVFHGGLRALRRDAARRVPADRTLARAALDPAAHRALFRGADRVALTRGTSRTLAAGLRSRVELLARRGWT